MEIQKGQPITLPDGTVILPQARDDGKRIVTSEQIAEERIAKEVEEELEDLLDNPLDNGPATRYRRTLADINIDFDQMNVYMLAVAYDVWGLDAFAISHLMRASPEKVEAILSSETASEIRTQLVEALRFAETASVHGYIASQALPAAKAIAATLKSPSVDARLAAAKDLLDRSGFRPADRVEHTHKFEDELRIRYVEDVGKMPVIDLKVEN